MSHYHINENVFARQDCLDENEKTRVQQQRKLGGARRFAKDSGQGWGPGVQ